MPADPPCTSYRCIDPASIEAFLAAIGRDTGTIVIALFPPRATGGGMFHFTIDLADGDDFPHDWLEQQLRRLPTHSAGIVIGTPKPAPPDWGRSPEHWIGDRQKAWGAQAAHIATVGCIVQEADGHLPREAQEALPAMAGLPEPTFSVWTGGKSLHHYWALTPGQELEPEQYRSFQQRATAALHDVAPDARIDASLCKPNQVMRLAGTRHPDTGVIGEYVPVTGRTFARVELDEVLPALPTDDGTDHITPQAAATGWFSRQPRERQRVLVADMLRHIPQRQAPGTGTYPQAFSVLAALVHWFGPDEAVELATETGWAGDHWDVAAKARSIGDANLKAGIGKVVTLARAGGWELQTTPRTTQARPPAGAAPSADGGQQQGASPMLSAEQVRAELQAAVDADLGGPDLSLKLVELWTRSGIPLPSLREIHSDLERQLDAIDDVDMAVAEAEAEGHAPAPSLDDLFPPSLALSLRAVTWRLPYDDISVAMAYLTCVSGLCKLGTTVCGNRITNYIVPTNLYTAIVGRSGQKKSPLERLLVIDPASAAVKDLLRSWKQAMEKWEEENRGRKASERIGRPVRPTIQVNDYTNEALVRLLQELDARGLGCLVRRDELAALFGQMNAYRGGRGADEQQLLEMFDGAAAEQIRTAGERYYGRCHVSIYGGIQPETLDGLIAEGDPTGKWARFIFCRLPVKSSPLPLTIDPEEMAKVELSRATLADIALAVFREPARTYDLEPAAVERFAEWELARQERSLGAHSGALASLWGKSAGKVLRLAGLLHIVSHVADGVELGGAAITVATLETAIKLVEHLDQQAAGIHRSAETERMAQQLAQSRGGGGMPIERLMYLIQRAAAESPGEYVSWREIRNRRGNNQLRQVRLNAAMPAMHALARLGYGVVEEFAAGSGAPRAMRYAARDREPYVPGRPHPSTTT